MNVNLGLIFLWRNEVVFPGIFDEHDPTLTGLYSDLVIVMTLFRSNGWQIFFMCPNIVNDVPEKKNDDNQCIIDKIQILQEMSKNKFFPSNVLLQAGANC